MIAPARIAAFDVLCRIETESAHSDDALNSESVSQLDVRDRNLVTEITYGTLRWRSWLDYLLDSISSRPVVDLDPKVLIVLRMSLYQMSRMSRIPSHAVVNDAVELTRRQKSRAAGFVNGVLRSVDRRRPWESPSFHRDCPMWVRASLPHWLWDRWESRFGAERAFEYAVSLNTPPIRSMRAKEREGSRDTAAVASGWERSELVPGALLAVDDVKEASFDGWYAMDEASQLVPQLLGPMEDARIWDACAAPGGKSAVFWEMCGRCGSVTSSDYDWIRARRLRERLASRGPGGTRVLVADARCSPPFRTRFDAVLADVPCSGLGTLRRNPEIKWRLNPEQLQEQSVRQKLILDRVSTVVQGGGRLLYSTCSTEPEENEHVIGAFLKEHPQFRLSRPTYPTGIERWLDSEGNFRSFPSERLWDGFFAALMIRDR